MIRRIINALPRKYLIFISLLLGRILPVVYHGKGYHCPVCGGNFRGFLPYGRKWVKNRMCPRCFSLERHRQIWKYLVDELDFTTLERNMLHIAPEQCFYKKFSRMENLDYITGDLESPLARIKMDITDIPYPDDSFDLVMANHVLEHIEEDRKAMQEIYRVTKKGGYAILQVPLDRNRSVTLEDNNIKTSRDRERFFWGRDHVRLYGHDYYNRLKNSGFKVENKEMFIFIKK